MTSGLYNDEFNSAPRPPRALVVDDNFAIRIHMGRLLAAGGYLVMQAENGAEALDVLRGAGVDLVVTDVWMPEMNGAHFARHVWREHPGMPIVFVSGLELDEKVEELLAAGNGAFLAKPFSPEALEAAIDCVRDATRLEGSSG